MPEYRVHGPPGTGKTSYLARELIPKNVERFGAEAVVVCSLTRAAAREIVSRDIGLPAENVGTLHALAWRMLERPEIAESTEHLREWAEEVPAYAFGTRTSLDDPCSETTEEGASKPGEALMNQAQGLRHRMVPRTDWPEDVLAFQDRWEGWCQEKGLVDFTGLIEAFHAMFHVEHPASAEQPDGHGGFPWERPGPPGPCVLVVDEAQDCSVLELSLIRAWGSTSPFVVLVGDAMQAIYSWRGATPQGFLEPEIPEERNRNLTQSWRVPRAVHRLAVRWGKRATYGRDVPYKARDEEGEAVLLPASLAARDELLDRVEADVAAGQSVMVLASCGYMLTGAITEAKRRGLPFWHPYRPNRGDWNPLRGACSRLAGFLSGLLGEGEGEGTTENLSVKALHRALEGLTAADTIRRGKKGWLEAEAKEHGERKLSRAELAGIFEPLAFRELQEARVDGTLVGWWASRLRRPAEGAYAVQVAKRFGSKALREHPRLVFGTAHSVKGGEADVVYLAPDLSPSFFRGWITPGEEHEGLLRLFYVAMTRAKVALRVLSPEGRHHVGLDALF